MIANEEGREFAFIAGSRLLHVPSAGLASHTICGRRIIDRIAPRGIPESVVHGGCMSRLIAQSKTLSTVDADAELRIGTVPQ
jgi:hypothetical protein